MKQGNFAQESSTPLQNPFSGGTYAGNVVPVNPVSAKFLQFYRGPLISTPTCHLQQPSRTAATTT